MPCDRNRLSSPFTTCTVNMWARGKRDQRGCLRGTQTACCESGWRPGPNHQRDRFQSRCSRSTVDENRLLFMNTTSDLVQTRSRIKWLCLAKLHYRCHRDSLHTRGGYCREPGAVGLRPILFEKTEKRGGVPPSVLCVRSSSPFPKRAQGVIKRQAFERKASRGPPNESQQKPSSCDRHLSGMRET